MILTLEDYLKNTESKYAVIGADAYASEPLARSISSEPARFSLNSVEYVFLSLDPSQVAGLAEYITQTGKQYEFGFVQGSGKVSFLTHSQAQQLKHDAGEQ